MQPQPDNEPIINCHAHIFTGAHVPPRLGRTFLPLGLYWVLTVPLVIAIGRWWYMGAFVNFFRHFKKTKFYNSVFWISWAIRRYTVVSFLFNLFGWWVTIQAVTYAFDWLFDLFPPNDLGTWIQDMATEIAASPLFIQSPGVLVRWVLVLFVVFFFPSGRNLALFILKNIYRFLKQLPGKSTREFARRYINLGRFALYKEQFRIYSRLNKQYPPGSKFVVLPMDMQYMGAGDPAAGFEKQMEELVEIKKDHPDTIYPFVFIHPERMRDTGFFDYRVENGKVVLAEKCLVKRYIEDCHFSGFKIYPALGYYPFEKELLPLWLYAQQHDLPIMTHCIIGTIFYRGKKLKKWNHHPVFKEVKRIDDDDDDDATPTRRRNVRTPKEYETSPLRLYELQNKEFQRNFTHPLNYLCLLDDECLIQVLKNAEEEAQEEKGTPFDFRKLHSAFGFQDGKLEQNLNRLKICFGHFGGDDEWKQYFELDRHNYVHQLTQHPRTGIEFFDDDRTQNPGRIAKLWEKRVDWYSIICSMMLKYPCLYADISYIVHNPEIVPLLKHTLGTSHPRLRERVLYGTDYYVVRNHKSDREMLTEMKAALSEEEFNLIARMNPVRYLQNTLPVANP